MNFPKIDPKQSFPKMEMEILEFWEQEKIFEKSLTKDSPKGEFKFFDGPPFATGLPHYGHILQGVVKDMIPRFKTMRGFRVPRVWGWDCHGLPVENLIEQDLNLKNKKEIESFGVAKFNEKCRESVLKFAAEWQKTVLRMGRWIDFEDSYKTMDLEFMNSVWWVFGKLWEQNLIYKGLKPMHICPRCETPLSNFEVGLGYKEITDLSATVKFELVDEPNTFFLAWTTTPWTLPGNVALAVGAEIEYSKVKIWNQKTKNYEKIILAKSIFENAKNKNHFLYSKIGSDCDFTNDVQDNSDNHEPPEILETFSGSEFVGKKYKPLFEYFADKKNDPHEVIPGLYFITFNTENEAEIFKNEKLRDVCVEAFRKITEKNNYAIYELVVMPNHVHLVVKINEDGDSLPKILQNLKEESSHELKEILMAHTLINPTVNSTLKRGVNGNNLAPNEPKSVLETNYHDRNGRTFHKLWRCSYDKKFIYSKDEFAKISDYIHQNLEKKNLPSQKYDWLKIFDDVNQPVKSPPQITFRIIAADFVTTDEGTGIVHIAPAFGEDDYEIAKKENLPVIQHVSMNGKFTEEVVDFKNLEVKPAKNPRETDEKIVKFLGDKIFATQNYKHSYPFCWRCDSPLLNYATSSWFVAVEKIKEKLLEKNEEINWIPCHIKNGRFGKWLNGARDWAISRNRFWGTPLPIWQCEKCKETRCVTSKEELEKLSNEKINDIHKHFVDEIKFRCQKCNGEMRRIPEVLDCWFESGSMPFAQFSEKGNTQIPADFIAEAQDQTRGWFYTLHILATAITNKPAFSNCVCSGLILAEDGEKMSKSKNNFPPPSKIFEKYGADAMRLYLMSSPVVHAEDLRFSERGVEETLRGVLLPLWNTFYFFTTYANADGWKNSELPAKLSNPLDRWILSELNLLIQEMTNSLEKYEIQKAVTPLAKFLDGLTNWYIRRSRRRFWKSENDADKNEAYSTLFEVLKTVSKLLAPICPFIAEKIYKDLTGGKSVHLEKWSEINENRINKNLSIKVAITRKIISLGLKIRATEKIKIRQPLANAIIAISENSELETETIREELNVKKIEFAKNPETIAEKSVVVNARLVGKKFGAKVQKIIMAAKNGKFEITKNGVKISDEILSDEEVTIEFRGKTGDSVASDSGIVVALDTKITPELKLEGKARDLVRVIQDLRKKAELDVSDRIELQLEGADEILTEFEKYISDETLAEKVSRKVENPIAEISIMEIKIGVRKI